MSIDPYNDVEIYEAYIEDKIVEVIILTDTPKKEMEEISQKVTDPPAQTTTPIVSTSEKENIVMTDIISQNITK